MIEKCRPLLFLNFTIKLIKFLPFACSLIRAVRILYCIRFLLCFYLFIPYNVTGCKIKTVKWCRWMMGQIIYSTTVASINLPETPLLSFVLAGWGLCCPIFTSQAVVLLPVALPAAVRLGILCCLSVTPARLSMKPRTFRHLSSVSLVAAISSLYTSRTLF